MKRSACWFSILAVVILFVISAMTVHAAPPLKVSDFGDLQAAIDAAREGDTIVVDVDTPGALVNKRLIIRGVDGKGAGGLISGTRLGPKYHAASTGLVLSSTASGTELTNLRIEAAVGIASDHVVHDVIPADDITVRGCTITASDFGFYLVNIGFLENGSSWNIEHNIIDIRNPIQLFDASWAVALSRQWENMRIAHNKISAVMIWDNVGSVAIYGGVVVLGGADVEVVQNDISVNMMDNPDHPWADPVLFMGTPSISNVTVAMNDLRGSLTARGPFGVTYVGFLDDDSDRTGLEAFDHIPASGDVPGTFSVGGNLSSGLGNRGGLSTIDLGIYNLLNP